MSRSTLSVDMNRIKSDLVKGGATASQIKEITATLADKVKLTALESEANELRKALSKIEGKIAKLSGEQVAPAKSSKRRAKKAAVKQISSDKVVAFLEKNAGSALRREEIAAGMKVDSKALAGALSELIEQKKVKRAGKRRGTTYVIKG